MLASILSKSDCIDYVFKTAGRCPCYERCQKIRQSMSLLAFRNLDKESIAAGEEAFPFYEKDDYAKNNPEPERYEADYE